MSSAPNASTEDHPEPIGLVGTGTMGAAMATALLEADRRLVVHDARPEAAAALVERGAEWAASPAEVGARCRVVLSSLPGPAEVEAVCRGEAGLFAGARAGDVHAGLSTVSVPFARQLAEWSSARGLRYLDAPVSGGAIGIQGKSLTVMASGDPAALDMVRPVLEVFSARIFDLGTEPGLGTLLKLVNNAIFLCSGLIHQEAVVLATKAGVDPKMLDDVLKASSAQLYLALAPLTLSRAWDNPFFSLGLAEKDLALALDSARSLAVPMPVTAAAHQHYLRGVAAGLGAKLCLSTLAVVESAAGVEVPARQT
jgi:3-hydroxyisobutyrate dehydrogenase-like beta-hydroxyacid dehydrogenase